MIEGPRRKISEFVNVTDYVANGSFAALKENVAYRYKPDYAILVRLVDHNSNWAGPFVYVDRTSFDFLRKSALEAGDVVVSNVGANAGTVFRVPDLGRPMTLGPNSVVLKGMAVPRYWYFFFCSPQGQAIIQSIISGSAHPKFNKTDLRACVVPYPREDYQDKVASTLGVLDDKIELNRRMNETLEAMARTIFKDWFVDFGPTRAKAEGRAPYLAPELWNLFPDALDDEDKPCGWEVRKLEDFLELAYGKSLPAKKRKPGNVAVYGSGGLTGTHDTALVEGPAVIVGRKGTVGSLYWEDGPTFPIDTVFYVVPRIGSILFSYHLLASHPLRDMNTDAAVPGLNRGNVYRLEFPLPASELISAFEDVAGALWKYRAENLKETETITQTRDLLLPKLMSGGIRLREAEKAVEAVT